MLGRMSSRLSYANVMATIAVFLALGGGAYAVVGIPSPDGVIHGCYKKGKGTLRVISKGKCKNSERTLSWNQQGRQGSAGTNGTINGVSAGGALTGAYPSPGIAASAVGRTQLADGSVAPAKFGPQLLAQVTENFVPQTVATNTLTAIVFDEPDPSFGTFDPGGLYDPADPSKFVVPRAGVYEVSAYVQWAGNANGVRELRVLHLPVVGINTNFPIGMETSPGGTELVQSGALMFKADVGDVFAFQVQQTSGGNLNISFPTVAARWLGPAS